MKRIDFSFDTPLPSVPFLCLCLGSFDGIHRGHVSLFDKAKDVSEGPLGVLLFDEAPSNFLSNGKSKKELTPLTVKLRLLSEIGFEYAYIVKAEPSFFSLSPDDFISLVLKKIGPSRIVVGSDYRFGKMAKGEPSLLSQYFPLTVVPLLSVDGEKDSTRRIVRLLEEGNVSEANTLLGRPYEIEGKVSHGFQNGRKIGFPTANVELNLPFLLPKTGVYGGMCYIKGKTYLSLINIGTNPTVGLLDKPRIECFLEGFEGEIYGDTIYVDFMVYMRDEKKFPSLEGLKEQLQKDRSILPEALKEALKK